MISRFMRQVGLKVLKHRSYDNGTYDIELINAKERNNFDITVKSLK